MRVVIGGSAILVLMGLVACAGRPAAGQSTAEVSEPDADHPEGLTEAQRAEDFDALWMFARDHYPFFGSKTVDWDHVRELQRPRALAAPNSLAFFHVIEDTLDTLHDPHCMLNSNAGDSWRPVPQEVWAEWIDNRAVVTAVRAGTMAAEQGLRPGDEIVAVDGELVGVRVDGRVPVALDGSDPAVRAWALLSAVAGRHDDEGVLKIKRQDGSVEQVPTRGQGQDRPLVQGRRLGTIGHIQISHFGDSEAVEMFDRVLEELADTTGLVLDVRSNGGGDTAVARPIMGRFISERRQYAWMARREGDDMGERWPEYVEPRGVSYTGPVVIVVDRFSVSMAEGFAMGMHGMGRAQIVGTPMAGLGAAIGRVNLSNLGVSAQISTEPVYHLDGTPRWELVPDVLVDVVSAPPGRGDPILDAALETLAR